MNACWGVRVPRGSGGTKLPGRAICARGRGLFPLPYSQLRHMGVHPSSRDSPGPLHTLCPLSWLSWPAPEPLPRVIQVRRLPSETPRAAGATSGCHCPGLGSVPSDRSPSCLAFSSYSAFFLWRQSICGLKRNFQTESISDGSEFIKHKEQR